MDWRQRFGARMLALAARIRGVDASEILPSAPRTVSAGISNLATLQYRHPSFVYNRRRRTRPASLKRAAILARECGRPGADGTRTGPADLRSGQAGAVAAAQLHSPARARPARRRGHSAGRLLRAGGSKPSA